MIAVRRLRNASAYYKKFGRLPDYVHPQSYSEKVQWRKIFDRNPALVLFCDKFASRELVRSRAPGVTLPEIYWCGDDPDAIPLEALDPPFVVKPNNRSGCVIRVCGADDLEPAAIRRRCRRWLESPPYGTDLDEWAYGQTNSKIIVEQFLTVPGHLVSPPNLKVYVFGGTARWIHYSDRQENRRGVYTALWEPLPFDRWRNMGVQVLSADVPPPPKLDAMVASAEAIAAGFDHARVDLYNINGTVFFGEMTAYPYSGYVTWVGKGAFCDPFPPRDADDALGSAWDLPHIPWPVRLYRGLLG